MGKIGTAAEKVKDLAVDFKTHWKTPKEGYYVSYREFTNFVIGVGSSIVVSCAGGNLAFAASSMFVGAIYGLKMMDFAMMGIVGLVLGYIFSPINMILTDNLGSPPKKTMRMIHIANIAFTIIGILCFFVPQSYFESFMPALPQVVGTKFLMQVFGTYYNILVLRKLSPKFGKYRGWIIAGIIPYILTIILLTWFPYDMLSYHDKFWVMNLTFSIWGCFGGAFGQTGNMQNVISPNTQERTNIMSFGSFVYSLFPSIFNFIFPILAAAAGGMTDIKTYKFVVPAFVIVFAPLTLFLALGVKDRVVQEQDHKPQINMRKGFKEVLRNKYLWITNISGWIGCFSGGVILIINMIVIYAMRRDWALGIISSVLATACTPGMLFAPFFIKKFGKRNIVLACKYINVLATLISVAGVYLDSLILILISTYISNFLGTLAGVATSSMGADIWDYQQYISGERLDGCMGIFGYISAPLTTLAGLLVPTLYGMAGFTSDWNILYDPSIRTTVFFITVIVSGITGLLAAVPYHFYDLTEDKHAEIIDTLKARAEKKSGEEKEAPYVLNGGTDENPEVLG